MISKPLNTDGAIAFDLAGDDRARIDQFTRYFAEVQRVLFPFLVTRTGGDPSAASDCLQEVAVVLWKKHEVSWSLEDFRRYGYRCADIEARSYRRKCHRLGKRVVYLAPDVIQALGNDAKELAAEESEHGRRRLDALQLCLNGLDPVQRELLDARYDKDGTAKSVADIAKERDCKMEALYKRLERIRTSLQNCILKRLKELPT